VRQRETWLRSAPIVAYLAVQLILPWRGFLHSKLESRGNFSWNMYSKQYECNIEYLASLKSGEVLPVDYHRFFRDPEYSAFVLHGDVLPRFHAYVCDVLSREADLARLDGICLCSVNDGSYFHLIEEGVDVCTAPNYGVVE
jgi:vitamin K-dependent gamma-carboxylase-like protein